MLSSEVFCQQAPAQASAGFVKQRVPLLDASAFHIGLPEVCCSCWVSDALPVLEVAVSVLFQQHLV